MLRVSLIYIFVVVTLPIFFIYMTFNHPNYLNNFDDKDNKRVEMVKKLSTAQSKRQKGRTMSRPKYIECLLESAAYNHIKAKNFDFDLDQFFH